MTDRAMAGDRTDPHQILVLLDVAHVGDDEVLPLLPDRRRDRSLLRLSTESRRKPDAPGAMRGPYDWEVLRRAVESLAEAARRLSEEAGGTTMLYVAGRAPLPLFVQLGYALNKFSGEAWVLNPHRGGSWLAYPLEATPQAGGGGILR